MTQIDVSPNSFDMASTETLPLSFDMSAYIVAGEFIVSQSATLTQLLTNANYPTGLSGTPTVSGLILTQIVTALTVGRYRLTMTFTTNLGKIWSADLILNCPF